MVWALDFQFDSTIDGKAIKIASMVDEHTRESLLDMTERSITAEMLVDELQRVFTTAGGPPKVLRMDNGPELISLALQRFCENKVGIIYIPPGQPWNNGFIESFNSRLRKECLNRNYWTDLLEAQVVIGDFKHEHNHRHRHSSLGYRTPAEYATQCRHTHHPIACDQQNQLNPDQQQPGSKTRWTDFRGPVLQFHGDAGVRGRGVGASAGVPGDQPRGVVPVFQADPG